jgi:hypothetical protein
MQLGLALHNPKAPAAVPVVLFGCVVAQENPHAPLLQGATAFPFRFLTVMLVTGFQCGTFGKSPEKY